ATRRRISIVGFLVILLLVTVMTITMLKSYLIAMTIGLIMALLISPVHKFFLSRKIKPGLSALIVTLLLTFVIIAPTMTFAGLAAKQGISFGKWVTEQEFMTLESAVVWINSKIPGGLAIEINDEFHDQVKISVSS